MKKIITALAGLLAIVTVQAQGEVYKSEICLIYKGTLQTLEGEYSTATGKYSVVIDGKQIHIDSLHQKGTDYAAAATWYINNETIEINKTKYKKFGLPRVLSAAEITKFTEYKGVGIYRESGMPGAKPAPGDPEVIYVPVKAQCEFQPYVKPFN